MLTDRRAGAATGQARAASGPAAAATGQAGAATGQARAASGPAADATGPAGAVTTPEQLAGELSLAVGRLVRKVRRHSAGGGLGRPLLSVLVTLDSEGPLCPSELAAVEGVTRASMTPVLATGEELGLLARKAHPSDGRQHLVELTRTGRAILAKERASKSAWLAERIADLPEAARTSLEAALPALRALGSSEGSGPTPKRAPRVTLDWRAEI